MTFLLDTNILSEMVKPQPDQNVIHWMEQQDSKVNFISLISIAEIQRGMERMIESKRKAIINHYLQSILNDHAENLLPIDLSIALEWGKILARAESKGRRISVSDGFIAATASVHRLTLVTRNVKDFDITGLPLLNPFEI